MTVEFKELPRELDIEISAAIANYSVGIFRYVGADGHTFQLLGSGTLVKRGGRYGILTAHHCLHQCSPPVLLGTLSQQRIVFVLRGSRQITARTDELFEHELAPANPNTPSTGPDLTFIEIPPGERLSRFKAFGLFCPMDRDPCQIAKEFAVPGTCTVCFGIPEVEQKSKVTDGHLVVNEGKMHAFLGHLKEKAACRGRWDFAKIRADYKSSPSLPRKFNGVSGGGIWAFTFRKVNNEILIKDYRFVGVAFYQTPIRNGGRFIKGHFVQSVYLSAWRGFLGR